MIVRIRYEGGSTEGHEFKDGVEFADVNGAKDAPGSKLAYRFGGRQVRYLTVAPGDKQTIARIELVRGSDRSAPIVLAATVEAPIDRAGVVRMPASRAALAMRHRSVRVDLFRIAAPA